MKVRPNSNKMVTHPRTTSRRERALAQRTRELTEWEDPTSDRVTELTDPANYAGHEKTVDALIAQKIERAKADIAALNKKGIS